jgi:hypothetical protein
MRINSYNVVSRAVLEGIALGLNKAENQQARNNPHAMVEIIYDTVMHEICDVVDFESFESANSEVLKLNEGEKSNE